MINRNEWCPSSFIGWRAPFVSLKEITYRNLFGFSQSDRKGGSTGTYTVIVGYQSGRMVHQVSVSAQIAMLEVGSGQDHDFIRLVEDPAIADLGGRGKIYVLSFKRNNDHQGQLRKMLPQLKDNFCGQCIEADSTARFEEALASPVGTDDFILQLQYKRVGMF